MADNLNTQIANAQFNTMQAATLARFQGREDVADTLQLASAKFAKAISLYLKILAENPPVQKPAYQHPGHTMNPSQTIASIATNAGLEPAHLVHAVQDCIVNHGLAKATQGGTHEQVQFLVDLLGGQKASQHIFQALELDKHFPHPQHQVGELVKFTNWAMDQEWCQGFSLATSIEDLIKNPQTDLAMNKHVKLQIDFLVKTLGAEATQKLVQDILAQKAGPQVAAAQAAVQIVTCADLPFDHPAPHNLTAHLLAASKNPVVKKAVKNPILMAQPIVIDLQQAMNPEN